MAKLKSRISELERKYTEPYRWVWRNVGETDAEARARAGIAPNDSIIIICWTEQNANLSTTHSRTKAGKPAHR